MVTEASIECPFCGETISVLVDCSEDAQTYIEDCTVCCRPIQFSVSCSDGELLEISACRD